MSNAMAKIHRRESHFALGVVAATTAAARPAASRFSGQGSRRGLVMITVVVFVTVALTLLGIWGQTAVRDQRRQRSQLWRVQAARLAEAGLERALVRRAADADYQSETWTVPAEHLSGPHPAEVRIRVRNDAAGAVRRYEATADYPAGALRRARASRQLEIPIPSSRDAS